MEQIDAKVIPLLEDSVECLFFSTIATDNAYWDNLCTLLNAKIKQISAKYIWHRDEFQVHRPIVQSNNSEVPVHLGSITCFGDNIEDEWFIVYLALELSKHHADLIIQIRDDDGDFLLIEAADYLPSWANPNSTSNRVFIHQNKVHLIPSALHKDTELKVGDAIKVIAQAPEKTRASDDIQNAILRRIGNYPEKIQETFHRTALKLPLDVAALLTLKPALVAPLVNAYCMHDVIDAKALKNIDYDDCITVSVQFTKCLYAMLLHAKPLKNVKLKQMNEKKCALGHKLAAGYQILMNKPTLDIFSSKQFNNFMGKVNASGYFKGNIEGSREYNNLLNNAKEFYTVMECPINSQVAHEITNLKTTSEFHNIKGTLKQNTSLSEDILEDNEDWLNITTDHLNELLNSRYGKKAEFNNSDVTLTANNVTSKLSSFLMRTSDFEGIETIKDDEKGNVEFDPDDFVNSVQKMLDMITLGKEVTVSDEDDFDSEDDTEDVEELADIKQEGLQDSHAILQNIVLSMKEEGLTGPSSNLMKSAGFNKTDFLDSDDDE